ncbi:lytic transglycosylase domain-containing protein [Vibrio astriarenae]|uniref:lytic transglycosylase domain-containing protein n=1 Tax=Vibrio astriarenae TaxID=1481923 RepID=UPI003736350B
MLLPLCCQASNRYDEAIKEAWENRISAVHWGHGWAQVKQESGFDCSAVSPAGAMGCAQFMPGTWNDMVRLGIVPEKAKPFNPRYSFQAQAFYMEYLLRTWNRNRTYESWVNLATASYNAGLGNVLKAQKLCGYAAEYGDIVKCLPDVTGRHHKETLQYVNRINRYRLERFGK